MSPLLISVPKPNAVATSQDIFVRRFAGELEHRGLRWRPLASAHGLDIGPGPGGRVLVHSMQAFFRDAQLCADDPLLGWTLGNYELKDFGLQGYAATNAPDLRSALNLLAELSALVSEACGLVLSEADGTATLAHRCSTNSTVSEFSLRIMSNALAELAGPDFRPLRMGINQADAPSRDRLADQTGLSIEGVDAPITFLMFHARLLDRPIHGADACLARTLRPLWQEECARLRARNVEVQEFQMAILPLLPFGAPTRARVAAALGISTRDLSAKLDRLGTTLPNIVDAVRAGFCTRLLARHSLSLRRAAQALGFTDPAEFVHAHMRWWNTPPRDGRGRLLH